MTTGRLDDLERDWAQVGVLFGCAPSGVAPDLERLLLNGARACPDNVRLVPLVVTWLVLYGQFVARHRLKRLVQAGVDAETRAVLGFILEAAVERGGTRELLIVSGECPPLRPGTALARVQRDGEALRRLAERRASALSRAWGVWFPGVELKCDAIRPVAWVLERNAGYADRIVRKGDLRVSIIEALRHDLPGGRARSEVALAQASGATRAAVRKALRALELEGVVTVGADAPNGRDHPVVLRRAA